MEFMWKTGNIVLWQKIHACDLPEWVILVEDMYQARVHLCRIRVYSGHKNIDKPLFSLLPQAGAQLRGPQCAPVLRVLGWRSRFWSGAP